jgi:uncharacterized protein (TIGR02001 family)
MVSALVGAARISGNHANGYGLTEYAGSPVPVFQAWTKGIPACNLDRPSRSNKMEPIPSIWNSPSRGISPMGRAATIAVVCATLSLGALTALGDDAVSVSLTPSLVSQYMYRGERLGGFSFQPAVEVDDGNAALGVWSNFPLMNKVNGASDTEIDPYGSYTFTVNGSFSVVPGFSVYTYPNGDTSAGSYRSTFEPYISVNYTIQGVTLTPRIYYDFVLEGPTFELNATYSVPIKSANTSLAFAATIGSYEWDDSSNGASPKVKNWGDYWLLGVSAPFTLSKKAMLTVGISYMEGFDNYYKRGVAPEYRNAAAVGRGVASISYAYTF